jgi:hypothetical protein
MYHPARFRQHHAELIAHSRACVRRSRELIAKSRRRIEVTVDLVSASVEITHNETPLLSHVARQYVREKGRVAAIAHLYRKESRCGSETGNRQPPGPTSPRRPSSSFRRATRRAVAGGSDAGAASYPIPFRTRFVIVTSPPRRPQRVQRRRRATPDTGQPAPSFGIRSSGRSFAPCLPQLGHHVDKSCPRRTRSASVAG